VCNFERDTGNLLFAVCVNCDKSITGIPYEEEYWVMGECSFCNRECYDNNIKEMGEALEQQELDEIYGHENEENIEYRR
jgi:hypothetical protein